MVRLIVTILNHITYSHTTNWNYRPPPPLFNIITIQDKGSHYNEYLLSDAIFVLGVVIVWFNFSRGDHFAVGSAVDDVKSFLIHVDEYKSNVCS